MVADHLHRWHLTPDGSLLETHTSWLLPVRRHGRPAMLKCLKPASDESAAAGRLHWFAGHGAVQLLAADDGALLMERADDAVSLRVLALSGGDHEAAGILADCVRCLHAPRHGPLPTGLTP